MQDAAGWGQEEGEAAELQQARRRQWQYLQLC